MPTAKCSVNLGTGANLRTAHPQEMCRPLCSRDPRAAGASLLLPSVDWTDSERDLAMSRVLKLVGLKPSASAKRQENKARSGDRAPRAQAPQKT
jgi:hypothetical protein